MTLDANAFVPHDPGSVEPAGSLAELRRRAADLLPRIGQQAAARERDRQLPYPWIRRIADRGLYTWRIPQAWGGAGGQVSDVIRFIIDVAAVDSNVAQALRPGFGFIEGILFGNDRQTQERWFPRNLAGEIFANAGWERGGPNGQITARLRRDGEHWRADGTKFYSTGALYADWISSYALDDEGVETAFTIPRNRPGLTLVDDFDAIGQRLTASGTTVFEGVEVKAHEVRRAPPRDRLTPITPFYQLFLAAVEAGIARNALDDAIGFARHHARPIKHSSAQRSVDDPYVREAVGQIATHAYAADAVVMRAARSLDDAWAAGASQQALNAVSIEIAQAQYFAVEAALRAAERVFDVGGASTTLREHDLDRHWRNARTVANHNPRDWKSATIGAYLLTGQQPPTTGFF